MSTWLLRIWSPCADLLSLHGHVMFDAFINALLRNLIGVMYACAIGRQVACRDIHISKKCEVMEQGHDIIPGIFFLPLVYIMYCSFFLAMFIRFIDHSFINIHSAMQEILYGGVQCIH